MKQMMTVFRFTYRDTVRKKAFRITTVIVMAVIVLACAAVNIFGGKSDAPGAAENESAARLFFLDEADAIPGAEEALAAYGYIAQRLTAQEKADVLAQVAEDGSLVLVETRAGERPEVCVYVKDFMSGVDTSAIKEALSAAWTQNQLLETGLSREEIAYVTQPLLLYQEAAGQMDMVSYCLGLVVTMIMFFSVYFYGLIVANSVAMEKTSRVMETLVVSARPRNILLGKCLASGAAGLTQLLLLLLTAVLSVKLFLPDGVSIMGMTLSVSGLSMVNILLLLAYFLLGFALYAMLNAVCGASVSRVEDVTSAEMPLAILAMASFYIGYISGVMGGSSGAMEAIAIYVPFCSPFGMPMRLLNGEVTMTQAAISLGILAATIAFVSAACTRLYEASVMYYGNRLRLKDMLKLKK